MPASSVTLIRQTDPKTTVASSAACEGRKMSWLQGFSRRRVALEPSTGVQGRRLHIALDPRVDPALEDNIRCIDAPMWCSTVAVRVSRHKPSVQIFLQPAQPKSCAQARSDRHLEGAVSLGTLSAYPLPTYRLTFPHTREWRNLVDALDLGVRHEKLCKSLSRTHLTALRDHLYLRVTLPIGAWAVTPGS